MTTPADEFPTLLDLALAEVQAGTRRLMDEHRLAEQPGWALDEEHGELSFGGGRRFVAQVAGLFVPAAGVWKWAWAEPSFPPAMVRAAANARGWGQANGVPALTTPTGAATEDVCWKLAAFAARLVGLPAVYRGAMPDATFFIAFGPRPVGHGLLRPPG